jgi:G-patch domain/R3H domain
MDKADRKVVHELANAFNLKSKSAGSGNKRFPVLYRTSQRTSFSEVKFAAVEARLTRRFLPRMDLRGRNTTSTLKRSGRGGFASTAVSYRDGDIVGGSAPELGIENKGRAMLEKMGWSTGTALGALNNKGILQPVSHVVKTTKAGLG